MQRKSRNEVQWLQFDNLTAAGVTHGVFLRHGGVGNAPYDSLNVGTLVGDETQTVINNIERIKEVVNLPSLHSLAQVHGKNIVAVDGPLPSECQGDALLCKSPGQALMVKHANYQVALYMILSKK